MPGLKQKPAVKPEQQPKPPQDNKPVLKLKQQPQQKPPQEKKPAVKVEQQTLQQLEQQGEVELDPEVMDALLQNWEKAVQTLTKLVLQDQAQTQGLKHQVHELQKVVQAYKQNIDSMKKDIEQLKKENQAEKKNHAVLSKKVMLNLNKIHALEKKGQGGGKGAGGGGKDGLCCHVLFLVPQILGFFTQTQKKVQGKRELAANPAPLVEHCST